MTEKNSQKMIAQQLVTVTKTPVWDTEHNINSVNEIQAIEQVIAHLSSGGSIKPYKSVSCRSNGRH